MYSLANYKYQSIAVDGALFAGLPDRQPPVGKYSVLDRRCRRCLRSIFLLLPLSFLAFGGSIAAADLIPSTAFFYAARPPLDRLAGFDRVVVESENVSDLKHFQSRGAKLFAYVSVGEAEGWRESAKKLPQELFLGNNKQWQSRIADLTRAGWKHYLLEDRIAGLWAQGYRCFFLDTLDSYQIPAGTSDERKMQATALVDIIRSIHERFPGVQLLLNRGFEVLPDVAYLSVGLVAESLFQGWNAASQQYFPVAAADREWLLNRLTEARDHYGLPVTVIDYVDPQRLDLIMDTTARITALGFFPWVSTPSLDVVYIGAGR